jgi:hypothetical protein
MNPVRATIRKVGGNGTPHEVLFNPASLKVSLNNRIQDEDSSGGKGQPRQNTRVTTTKLETELVYDTTDIGQDVRDKTSELKAMAVAVATGAAGAAQVAPPPVEFRWGRFSYQGVIESLNETLDFWANEGVPLRATIQLVIQNINGAVDTNVQGVAAQIALNPVPSGGTGATGVATRAGAPAGGRAIAAANGMESMRFGAGASVAVSAGVQLQAAAGFSVGFSAGASPSAGIGFGIGASAGAGIGAGGGIGLGISGGAAASAGAGIFAGTSAGAFATTGISASASADAGAFAGASASAGAFAGASAGAFADASAGFGASAGASFGASASAGFGGVTTSSATAAAFAGSAVSFGASASAGVSASDGAFAGLGVSSTTLTPYRLDPMRALPPPVFISGQVTQFDVTGRAIVTSSLGLSANVGGGVRFI